MNYLLRRGRKGKLTPEENNKEDIAEIKKYYPKELIGLSKKITTTILKEYMEWERKILKDRIKTF